MKGLIIKMNKIVNDNLKVGDKFKGNINKEIFEIISIDESKGYLKIKHKEKILEYKIDWFKRILLTKI